MGLWPWLVVLGLLAALALEVGFLAQAGLMPGLGGHRSQEVSTAQLPTPETGAGSREQGRQRGWTVQLAGEKMAAPVDLDSRGVMNGVIAVTAGDPIAVYGYSGSGELQWRQQFRHGQGLAPRHLAPLDYDGDGHFDEILVVISGGTTPPGTITIGPEAYVFNFFVLDGRDGEVLWSHQCGHLTRPFPGARLAGERCTTEEADSLYRELLAQHGYIYAGRPIDEGFLRVDTGGNGRFEGSIRLPKGEVQVH